FYMDEATDVVNYTLLVDGSPVAAGSSTPSITISGANDAGTADYEIADNDDNVQIIFTVETEVSGSARVRIDSVDYSAGDDNTEELNVTATPASDWRSGALILN
ncbi:MAG TPA: hypothetical protein VKP88_06285, partial [Candidatus Paceibacterota bacterium]|nr:hypothetical protein [Candidatus Paceibacterota bacterium]